MPVEYKEYTEEEMRNISEAIYGNDVDINSMYWEYIAADMVMYLLGKYDYTNNALSKMHKNEKICLEVDITKFIRFAHKEYKDNMLLPHKNRETIDKATMDKNIEKYGDAYTAALAIIVSLTTTHEEIGDIWAKYDKYKQDMILCNIAHILNNRYDVCESSE